MNPKRGSKTHEIALSGLLFALAMALSFVEGTLVIARRIAGMPGHVNLIPLNDVVESPFKPSRRIAAFQKRLESHGITATVRRSLGGDIDASCGQLRRRAMEERKGEDPE